MIARKITRILCLSTALLTAGPAQAEPGDAERGEAIYFKRCVLCHGEEGDGLGPAAERLNPPPRDFSLGQYKIKSTGFDDIVPNDEDLFRMIDDGMPGTAMPGWGDMLSAQDIRDLIAYIKIFAGFEEETPSEQVDYGSPVESSPESIARGRELFHEGDRCSECHGEDGKGDAIKGLKDDSGFRTWPRNLTKPWTFRASNEPKDIYTRISTGIPGTQMPSFADPASKKKLDPEDRWHVANYVNSLAKIEEVVRPENTVIKAARLEAELPEAPDAEAWDTAEPTTFLLVPQLIAADRFFTPSNDTITVRALYNDEEVGFLLEWDDRTRSTPGDEKAEKISDPDIAEDAVAIQLPIKLPAGSEKPYFLMGDAAHPVNFWQWKSGSTETPASVTLMNSRGIEDVENRDAAGIGIRAQGMYERGTWRVAIKRALTTADPEQDIQFVEGAFIPVAFTAWDGSNSENGSRRTLTTWYWLLLKPAAGNTPLMAAVAAFVLILLAEIWWARGASRRVRGVRGP